MPENTLIRILRGRQSWELPLKALTGKYLSRIEKVHKIQIVDPDLHDKLNKHELKALSVNFPELDPDLVLPPEPKPLTDTELGDLVAQPVAIEVTEVATEETETPEPTVQRRGRKPKKEIND
jgi:hypothetical protein